MYNIILTPGVIIVAVIALSITVASFYVSRIHLPKKMKTAYRKSITALAAAVETKDAGTVGHAQRVARLAVDTARRVGVAGRELERLEYAALLMDIGKAKVPQAILNKKASLNEDEWEVIKNHTRLGADMAEAAPFLADLSDAILHHHEYWDGTGYPDGLRGKDIPLGSRILSLAADFDAMVSERPYHPRALTQKEAIDEIRRYLGAKYDPEIGLVFVKMIEAEVSDEEPVAEAA